MKPPGFHELLIVSLPGVDIISRNSKYFSPPFRRKKDFFSNISQADIIPEIKWPIPRNETVHPLGFFNLFMKI